MLTDFDQILPLVGEFGRYQKSVLWFILLPAVFPCGFHAYNQLFMATIPEHWCHIPELDYFEKELARNMSIPLEIMPDGELKFSNCRMYDKNYSTSLEKLGVSDEQQIPCRNGWVYKLDNTTSVVAEWNLVCSRSFYTTLTLVLLGGSGLIGNYLFGYIQDGMGRKPAFYIYLLIQCIFGVLTSFAPNYIVWTICRVGVGFTVPAILGTPYVLAIELVGPRHRTIVTILINIAYSLSLVTLAIIVWLVRDWRWMSLSTTVPFIGLFFHWWLLPESPRWLLSQGRIKEAEIILKKIAKANGKKVANVKIQVKSDQKPNLYVGQVKYGISDLFKTPNLRWKTIIITFLWFTNTSVYVGLSYYAPALGGDEYLNFFLAGAVEFPTYLFLWPAMERLGRRWTLCISMIVGGASCLATFLVQKDYLVTLVLYCVGKMGISSSFVVLPLVASELYPTVVRGLGMSFSSVIGMIGPIIIPLVNYLGSDYIILPLLIMGTMLIIGGSCSLLLPETLHQHLPQSLPDAEKAGLDCFICCPDPPVENSKSKSYFESSM